MRAHNVSVVGDESSKVSAVEVVGVKNPVRRSVAVYCPELGRMSVSSGEEDPP